MEGGAIDVNGRGTLLTTEECLLGEVQARNPGLDRAELERSSPITWASATSSGWAGASPATTPTATSTTWRGSSIRARVVTVVEPRADDPNHEPLQDNLQRLAGRPRPGRRAAPRRRAAHAPAGGLRRPAAAGQLRQLLHRQRPRARPHLQRPGRPRRPRHPGPGLPRPRGRRRPLRRPGPRPGHACTACRSSSRRMDRTTHRLALPRPAR